MGDIIAFPSREKRASRLPSGAIPEIIPFPSVLSYSFWIRDSVKHWGNSFFSGSTASSKSVQDFLSHTTEELTKTFFREGVSRSEGETWREGIYSSLRDVVLQYQKDGAPLPNREANALAHFSYVVESMAVVGVDHARNLYKRDRLYFPK